MRRVRHLLMMLVKAMCGSSLGELTFDCSMVFWSGTDRG